MKNGWKTEALGNACEIYQPKTISGKQMVQDGPYPVFGANGIIGRYDKFNHKEPQLLITCRGATCGSVNVSEPCSWITGNAMVVRPKNGSLLMRYLEYLFRGGFDVSKAITGAAQPQITRTNLSPLEISYPVSVDEQQRIVDILDEAFEDITTSKANAEKNLQNAQTIFKSYLRSVLSFKKWGQKSLADVCERVEYGSSAKSKPSGRVPVLRMGNIQDGRFDFTDLVYSDNAAEIEKYLLKRNDVLFNRTNSPELVGKTAIYKGEMPAIFAGYLIRIHRNESLLDADYLNYYLNSDMAMDYGKTVMVGSVNQANINGGKLLAYPIPIPPLLEQKKIVAELDELRSEIKRLQSVYEKKLSVIEELRKALLHQAFTGQL